MRSKSTELPHPNLSPGGRGACHPYPRTQAARFRAQAGSIACCISLSRGFASLIPGPSPGGRREGASLSPRERDRGEREAFPAPAQLDARSR